MSLNEEQILPTWESNAEPWSAAVREKRIESRTKVTNDAVLRVVGPGRGRKVLDLGCGEGWLSREMSRRGWRVVGVDGSAALVDAAREGGDEEYRLLPYSELEAAFSVREFDLVVCNFSLLGERSTSEALSASAKLLKAEGQLVIQTVHPESVEDPHLSGWRTEDWKGFTALDWTPSPWYYHTLSDWIDLIKGAGFALIEMREPAAEEADRPSSLLLVAENGVLQKE